MPPPLDTNSHRSPEGTFARGVYRIARHPVAVLAGVLSAFLAIFVFVTGRNNLSQVAFSAHPTPESTNLTLSREPAPAEPSEVELTFWNSIKESNDSNDFLAYTERYPQGAFLSLARNRIKRLTDQAAHANASSNSHDNKIPNINVAPRPSVDVPSVVEQNNPRFPPIFFRVSSLRSAFALKGVFVGYAHVFHDRIDVIINSGYITYMERTPEASQTVKGIRVGIVYHGQRGGHANKESRLHEMDRDLRYGDKVFIKDVTLTIPIGHDDNISDGQLQFVTEIHSSGGVGYSYAVGDKLFSEW